MKTKNILILTLGLFLLYSCDFDEEPTASGENHSLSITGIKDAFSYSFRSASGKVNTIPDEVHTLSIKILDDFNHIVYEQWYYDWSDETNNIPDSIFIPSLAPGNYKVYASTTDNYYYYYDDYYYPEGQVDSSDFRYEESNFIIDSWVVSTNPIYVGNQSFQISEEDQEIQLEMSNISAKITVNYSQYPQNFYINAMLIGPNAYSYSFDDDELFLRDEGYDQYTDLYMYDQSLSMNYYVLPRTIQKAQLYVYDYTNNYYVEQSFSFDGEITMTVGDALTINLDIENILEGAGTGTLSWEAIQWNDIGELTFP